jgi:hypothetical protein
MPQADIPLRYIELAALRYVRRFLNAQEALRSCHGGNESVSASAELETDRQWNSSYDGLFA